MSARGNTDFLKLWAGQTVSEIGSRVTREGLPMTAVLMLGATPTQMGVLSATSTASVMAFGLFAGVIADRVRRRPLMIWTDLARAALLATVPFAAWQGSLGMTHLLVVAAIAGLLTVLFDVAYQAYLPALVDDEELLEGNRRLGMSAAFAEIVGPGITGILIQVLTAPIAILLDALSFLASAFSLVMIGHREEPAQDKPEGLPSRAELLEGVRVIRAHPVLRALLLRSMTTWLFGGTIMPLYVLLALRVVKLSTISFGFTVALGGIGALLGAWATRHLAERWPLGRTFFGFSLVLGVTSIGMPLAATFPEHGLWFLCLQQLFGDFAWSFYNVAEITFRQRTVDSATLGRANGVMQIATRGVLPIGALLGGVLAERFGIAAVLWAGAVGFGLASLWLLPVLRYTHVNAETTAATNSI
jgi:MFS family permease